VEGLRKYFPIERGLLRRVHGYIKAVDGVSLEIHEGETLGLVGESGCGKSTLGRCIVRAHKPTEGSVTLHTNGKAVDLATLTRKEMRPYKRLVQMIFQDPFSSLDPRMTVMEIVAEPLRINTTLAGRDLEKRVAELMHFVGMDPKHMRRYPHAFSGGQRQRIGIARAIALNPKLIIADEPVSALDVSIQAQILNLLNDLKDELGLSYLFVAHDLSVVEHMADRVAVMYVGQIVETAEKADLYFSPRHPYTEALLSAIPMADPEAERNRRVLPGEPANPAAPPPGCTFHPRCTYATEICRQEIPKWEESGPGRFVRCHRWKELSLSGNSRIAGQAAQPTTKEN